MGIQSIRLTEAKPDMVVAKRVVTNKGMVLCAEGTKLTEKLIARLEQMDVSMVIVHIDEEMSESDFQREKAAIEKRFSAVPPSSMLGILKTILLEKLETMRA